MQIQTFNPDGTSASDITEMPVIDPPTTNFRRQAKAWIDQAIAASNEGSGFFAVCGDLDHDITEKVFNVFVAPGGIVVSQNILQPA